MKLAGPIAAGTFGLMLAACGASTPAPHHGPTFPPATRAMAQTDIGTVVGTFMRVGGPLGAGGTQPSPIPLMGTVTFSVDRGHTVAVRVGKTGTFTLRLRSGVYQVSGRSPQLLEVLASGATAETPCAGPVSVTVIAGRTVHVPVVCAVP
jgi:hypothetical protein